MADAADEMHGPQTIKVVLLMGGSGSRFQPLSTHLPQHLFPVAGKRLIDHHVYSCSRVENLSEIILLGYKTHDAAAGQYMRFVRTVLKDYGIATRCLMEPFPMGTAGGLQYYRKEILKGSPSHILIMNADIWCSVSLEEMLHFHCAHGKPVTMLATQISKEFSHLYGCVVQDPRTFQVIHWAEKPAKFVSALINGGIYIFTRQEFEKGRLGVDCALVRKLHEHDNSSDFCSLNSLRKKLLHEKQLSLERDILRPMRRKGNLMLYETTEFWCQVKTPGMALLCSDVVMHYYRAFPEAMKSGPHQQVAELKFSQGVKVKGNVIVDPLARVHPTAMLGPNVWVGSGATVKAGVRLVNCIILQNAEILENAFIKNAIVGWNAVVGSWARIEGKPPVSMIAKQTAFHRDITILGEGVTVKSEVFVHNSIVMNNRFVNTECCDRIVL